jgi:hypothetical protein
MTPEERDLKEIQKLIARVHDRQLKSGADDAQVKANVKRLISECIDAGIALKDVGFDVNQFINEANAARNAGTNPFAPPKGGR